jgi:hypothetical protein
VEVSDGWRSCGDVVVDALQGVEHEVADVEDGACVAPRLFAAGSRLASSADTVE